MGNIFSNIKEANEVVEFENKVEKVEEIVKEIAEKVIVDVVEEVTVHEIEKHLTAIPKKSLQSIEENEPYYFSSTHYSNINNKIAEEKLEVKPLQQYKQTELTHYSKLRPKYYFSFYR
jgi:predicted enzyme involved in methoxymalonyl-ACP biosynthesis